ncbi:MAG: hypothetical protein COB65_13265, partial [Thalassobium sp.]
AADATTARPIFDPAGAAFADAQIVSRADLTAGQTVQGPAAIIEDETTIIVPVSRHAIRQPDGCIDIKEGRA